MATKKVLIYSHTHSLQLLRTASGNQFHPDTGSKFKSCQRGGKLVVQQAVHITIYTTSFHPLGQNLILLRYLISLGCHQTVYSNRSERLCLALRTGRNETRLYTRAKSNFPPGGGGGIYIGLYNNQFVNSIPIRAFRTNSILSIRLIWNAKQFNSIRASSEDLKDLLAPLV